MVLAAVVLLGLAFAREDVATCREKGFTEQLVCSSCALLQTYLPARTDIFKECQQCCANDEVDSALYVQAELSYNPKYLDGYPGVSEFLEKSISKFPNVVATTQARIWPRLFLLAADGQKTEEQIRYWTSADIEEFLIKRLAKTAEEKKEASWWSW